MLESHSKIEFETSISDRAWYMGKMMFNDSDCTIMPFGNIESMTIERFYVYFSKSNGDELYRLANIGIFTIDVKKMLMFHTLQPENKAH